MSRYILTTLMLLLPLTTVHAEGKSEDKQCAPTAQRMIGNSHKAGVAKLRANTGEGLVMRGRVLSAFDCSPIEDAIIERWQAGNDGKYHDRLRAYSMSLPDGSYEFETDWPNMSTPHIHFIVTVGGYNKLVTQWIPDGKVSEATFDLVLTPSMF